MDLRRRVLAMTVVGAGAVSVWGSFYITPYYGKNTSQMKNKSLFQEVSCRIMINNKEILITENK